MGVLHVMTFTFPAIDACSISNGGCEHICESTTLGRRCICRLGFMLDVDGVSCIGKFCISWFYNVVLLATGKQCFIWHKNYMGHNCYSQKKTFSLTFYL